MEPTFHGILGPGVPLSKIVSIVHHFSDNIFINKGCGDTITQQLMNYDFLYAV